MDPSSFTPVWRLSNKRELCYLSFCQAVGLSSLQWHLKRIVLGSPQGDSHDRLRAGRWLQAGLPQFHFGFQETSPRTLSLRKFFTHSLGTG